MTASPDGRPRVVRPAFLRWSTVVFVLLLPFVAHAIWDYVEARRLSSRIDALVQAGQPVTLGTNIPLQQSRHGMDADRFYRAGAALASGFFLDDNPQLTFRMGTALRTGDVPPALLVDLRARVEDYREALSLADRAAALPFERFGAGYTFAYLNSNLIALQRLCEMRAIERALAGDGDAAFASLYTDVRLERAVERPPPLNGLKLALERTHPSAAARAHLAHGLAEIDRDDFLKLDFMRLRALTIDQRGFDRMPWFQRPWMAHRLSADLDLFARLIAAAEQPEPGRVNAVLAVGDWPMGFPSAGRRAILEPYVTGQVKMAERIKCARRLVAGEVVNCQL